MKGKLCFIKRKSKNLVSNGRIFCGKISHFLSIGRGRTKTCGLSCETSLLFSSSSPFFGETTHAPSPPLPFAVSSSAASYARTDTPLRIAHSASSPFLPSPFTFTYNLLIHRVLRVKDYAFFSFTGEGKRGEAFTHKSLFHRFLLSCGEEVKAKNEKRRTRA